MTVRTRTGPHVTPELFSLSGGRIVCLTAASTLKARLARRHPLVGLSARSPDGVLTAVARAEVLDVADPGSALRSPRSALRSPLDVGRFVRDNAVELTGAAFDAVTGRLGIPPKRRATLVLTPLAAVVTHTDGTTWSEGWEELDVADDPPGAGSGTVRRTDPRPGRRAAGVGRGGVLDLRDLPDEVRLLVTDADVVVGWTRTDGTPLALPGRWDDDGVTVVRSMFDRTGAARTSPVGVTFDVWTGLGPSGKQGVMLRGEGRATRRSAAVRISVDVDRATHWDGVRTGTTRLTPH